MFLSQLLEPIFFFPSVFETGNVAYDIQNVE